MELNNEIIGQRLADLRKIYSDDTGIPRTQALLAKEMNVSQTVVARLEKGLGSFDSLIRILYFYHSKGYNIQWVIAPTGESISPHREPSEKVTDTSNSNSSELEKTLAKLNSIVFGKKFL